MKEELACYILREASDATVDELLLSKLGEVQHLTRQLVDIIERVVEAKAVVLLVQILRNERRLSAREAASTLVAEDARLLIDAKVHADVLDSMPVGSALSLQQRQDVQQILSRLLEARKVRSRRRRKATTSTAAAAPNEEITSGGSPDTR